MTQHKALILAHALECEAPWELMEEASVELRRLHSLNEELLKALKRVKDTGVFLGAIPQGMVDEAIAKAEGK